MPIDVNMVLIGDGVLYQLLSMYDEDFWEIFKVKAHLDFKVDRTRENMTALAAFIAACCEEPGRNHFGRTEVMEYASRIVDNQERACSWGYFHPL